MRLLDLSEPIYYDGDARFAPIKMDDEKSDILITQFNDGIDKRFVSRLKDILRSSELKTEFFKRTKYLNINPDYFFSSAVENYLANVTILKI